MFALLVIRTAAATGWRGTAGYRSDRYSPFVEPELVTFASAGGSCRGVLYRPKNTELERLPIIVMAHGMSGTRLTQYDRRARRLVESGAAVLDFDPRFIGTSPGEPRQRLDPYTSLLDMRSAVAYARSIDGIDRDDVGLYGSSLGCGVAFAVAAEDPAIRAMALDVPAPDGLRLTPAPMTQRPILAAAIVRDIVARSHHRQPVTIPMFGEVGSGAVLQYDVAGFWKAMEELEGITWSENRTVGTHPQTGEWRNAATALELLSLLRFRPALKARNVHCPVLAHLTKDDRVVPYRPTRRALHQVDGADVRTLQGGHFGPFYGEGFQTTVGAQIEFFARTLIRSG